MAAVGRCGFVGAGERGVVLNLWSRKQGILGTGSFIKEVIGQDSDWVEMVRWDSGCGVVWGWDPWKEKMEVSRGIMIAPMRSWMV